MADVSSVSSSASLYSAAGIEALIQQTMALERQPLTRLQQSKDELQVRYAIYSDVTTKMTTLRSAIEALTDSSTGAFGTYSASSSATSVAGVTAGTNPAVGGYNLVVDQLAQAHQLSSNQVAQTNEALGWSGTFVIGGAAARSVTDESTVSDTVDDFDTSTTVRAGQSELGTGQYYVEVRQDQDTTWQFRLVDETGKAVSIDDASDGDTAMTTAWQDLDLVAGTTFDTGRGLTIQFGSGSYTAGLQGAGAASVHYVAQGASISVESGDTLNDIRDAINAATYAEGNQVIASVIDRRLILSGAQTGSDDLIAFEDTTGTLTASELGLTRRSADQAQDLAAGNGVTSFATVADLVSFSGGALKGQAGLSSDRYYVEIGAGDHANQFRLLDSDGEAVAIASSSGGTHATTNWIDITDGEYDTGRGLAITFAGSGTYTSTTVGDDAANVVYDTALLQSPSDAIMQINGLSISRKSNADLTDIIQGLTLNLHATGSTQILVANNDSAVVKGASTFVSKVNDLLAYIRAKTEPQQDQSSSASSDQPTYTQAPLGSDWTLRGLRRNIAYDLLSDYADAATGAPSTLADVGITLSEDSNGQLSFEISDSSALESALSQDFQGTSDLFDHILGQITQRLSTYLDGDSAYLTSSQNGIDDQMEQLDNRISTTEDRLSRREEALRKQYSDYQAQIMNMQYEYQYMQSLMSGSILNQQT